MTGVAERVPVEGRLEVREVSRRAFVEFYLTGTPATEGDASEAGALFAQAAAVLARRSIQPIQEKIYGRMLAREKVLSLRAHARSQHGLDPGVPVTWIEGASPSGGAFAGFQIWGITPRGHGGVVETVGDGVSRGRTFEVPGLRGLYLPCVRGTTSDGDLPAERVEQAQRMFANASAALAAQGFAYRDVARTWIYFPRILDWYDEFNRVRTAHYAGDDLGGPSCASVFPASTGIQGRCGDEECFMDVLAVQAKSRARVRLISQTRRQGSAFCYGSAFSRGAAIEYEGGCTVHVSGTASIDAAGRTLHAGDPEGQSLETLLNVGAVLEEEGRDLSDVCSSTVFCKDPASFEAFQRVTRLLGIPSLPAIHVLADVCRPELLIEIEAVAAI